MFLVRKIVPLHIYTRLLHSYSLKMQNAYLRRIEDSSEFLLTFKVEDSNLKINREFNFRRLLTEPISSFVNRVGANIDKVISKRNRKQKLDIAPVQVLVNVNNEKPDQETKCEAIFSPNNNVVLNILEHEYKVIIDSPWIDKITLPNHIMASFPLYPSKFETVFTDTNLSKFGWYSSADKKTWKHVGQSYFYTPTNDDINSYLKFECIPKNERLEGPLTEVISETKVEASPGTCPFDTRLQFTKEKTSGDVFRVVTYNILADLYCDSDHTREVLYPYCPPYALAMDYRKQLILKEVMGYNADIICLQEVDSKLFRHDLQPVLSLLGYSSDFSIKGGSVAEGQACFYRSNRFKKITSHRVVLSDDIFTDSQFADIWEKVESNLALVERITKLATSFQVNVVESVDNEHEIVVIGNTHLYFHPDSDHIRLLQAGLVIRYLENLVEQLKKEHPTKRVSLIFCGDFNSTPECGVYKLYTTGTVPEDCIDFQSNKEEEIKNLSLKQPFKLESASGTPKYTNFTVGFADCLDYIFYEKNKFEVVQVVPLPSNEELVENTALPSVVFPSDHIALISDLKWLK